MAPVLGIVMGLAAGALFLSVFLTGSLLGIQPADPFTSIANTERFPNSPELAATFSMAHDIELGIRKQYPNGNWPSEIVADPSGTVAVNGVTLGTLLEGQAFTYYFVEPQGFTFTITGTVPGESVEYDSVTDFLTVNCYEDDELCESNLPLT
jgi:hypothetical protein